ncbi:DUF2891 domain-containing protein [Prosthecodimorpha staleyi]|uniref:DUF2891 domain-containing protein n=1 Tax=Prosthecodimorpha staleyi TaxID=2840188 RepID=A0A947GFR7_9HYPH|nr:DUF2891 domain-containing protein [Prosthecodimorpha staleyi]MBT9293151.1 DUF2891 domain-containing protein [Prosthecodimorpha staleyi]
MARLVARPIRALVAGFVLILATRSALPAETAPLPPEIEAVAAEARAVLPALAPPIADCIARHDTEHPVFHGCIDWHSAVHGHWALIALSAATGDPAFAAPALARLADRGRMAEEAAFLAAHPDFEMPYGRAWFLRLVAEHVRLTGRDDLMAIGDAVAASLAAYLDTVPPDPLATSYRSQSWALINLIEYATFRRDARLSARVRRLVRQGFTDERTIARACRGGVDRGSFMAVCPNLLWLVALTEDRASLIQLIRDDRLLAGFAAPAGKAATVHERGLRFSRAWGLWAVWRASGEPAAARAYAEHVAAALAARDWQGSYQAVGHWVAQFGVLALRPLVRPGT